jgi:stage II sporulation protein D
VTPKRVVTSPAAAWLAAGLGAWLVAASCRTVQAPAPRVSVAAQAEALGVPAPVVRVGIQVDVDRVSIGADSGLSVRASLPGEHGVELLTLPRATFRPGGVQGRLRLLETGQELEAATLSAASADEMLQVDATRYRGLVQVRPAEGGKLTVVNAVNLEDYVRGVVPNELSPEAFPQIEALKAQAVAARTYAVFHQGEYGAKGFDVCATQSCQVYRGQSSEQPLTDRATAETRGIVATWRGRPINAYYTSTCGGHTEDGTAVFDDAAPYLKGVECLPERSSQQMVHAVLPPRRDLAGLGSAARDVALLEALGVLLPGESEVERLRGIPADAELRAWTERLAAALHRSGCESPVAGALARRATFARHLVGSICWTERAERLLAPGDGEYLLQTDDTSRLDPGERTALALLVREGILVPGPDNALRPDQALTRADAIALLAGAALRGGAPAIGEGDLVSLADGQLSVLRGESAEAHPFDGALRLVRSLEGAHAVTSDLRIATGEHVRYVLKDGRVAYLESEQTRRGAAADRSSKYYNWEVRLTPREVAQAISRYGSVGEVRDLVPRRLGVSGRVVELAVEGSAGELLLKGLRVRWGLGLRENLFVIGRESGASGIERFVFTGKGWGHGVGLCQVGAFGMAQSGSSYEAILKHYYSGIALNPLAN